MIIPSGLYFDIPEGCNLEIFARSGISLKRKLNIINSVGKIDEDYVDQLYILVFNNSKRREFIEHGERIAQGEFKEYIQAKFILLDQKPDLKTTRTTGLGHTGTK
jgi:dUTP pyrophosphatase